MSRFFGSIRQNGYVVRDLQAAITHWTTVLGVGPFFFAERLRPGDFRVRGIPSDAEFAIAIGNSGDTQIELVQPLDTSPSMFQEFLQAGHEGMQHFAYWFDTPAKMDAAIERAAKLEYGVGHSGRFGDDGRFVFLLTDGQPGNSYPGTMIELSEVCGGKAELFRNVAEASRNWDGSDPIRPFKKPG